MHAVPTYMYHLTAHPSAFSLSDGALCQRRPSAAQTCSACTHDAPNRQPLLAAVTKDFVGFVFNEALLCIHSIITAIWLSRRNMPPHFARTFAGVSKGRTINTVTWSALGWLVNRTLHCFKLIECVTDDVCTVLHIQYILRLLNMNCKAV